MTESISLDVFILRKHGCNDAADKAQVVHDKMRIRAAVVKACSEWRAGCRGEYAAQFDAIAKAIYEKEFGGGDKDKPTGRETVAQVKPQEAKPGIFGVLRQ